MSQVLGCYTKWHTKMHEMTFSCMKSTSHNFLYSFIWWYYFFMTIRDTCRSLSCARHIFLYDYWSDLFRSFFFFFFFLIFFSLILRSDLCSQGPIFNTFISSSCRFSNHSFLVRFGVIGEPTVLGLLSPIFPLCNITKPPFVIFLEKAG